MTEQEDEINKRPPYSVELERKTLETRGPDGWIVCPECGDHYVHPIFVRCHSPGKENGSVTIDKNGVSIENQSKAVGRGTRIVLGFQCESSGHRFEQAFQFHKGNTIASLTATGEDDGYSLKTIWSD